MRIPCIFASLLFLSACKTDKEKMIIGKWNAVHLVECDEIVPINTSAVNLEFQPTGKYIFNSTLNVHEEGSFRIAGDYLYTHDKVKTRAAEKAVKIRSVGTDSLVLEMNYKGKEQWLTLMKEGSTFANQTTPQDKEDLNKATAVAPIAPVAEKNSAKNSVITEGGHTLAVVDKKTDKELPKTPTNPSKSEDKKVEKPTEKKVEKLTEKKTQKEIDAEKKAAYLKREAQRKKEEADKKAEHKKRHDAYLKREAQRKKEEAKDKADKKKK